MVKRLARQLVRGLCGFDAREPLSGQRAVTGAALTASRPLAPGFGMEVAMTIDAVRAGFRVREIAVPMRHVPSGGDLGGWLHRGRQGRDVLRAVAPRALRGRR
jgi:hypothetical protein